jgi:hypothetical protein
VQVSFKRDAQLHGFTSSAAWHEKYARLLPGLWNPRARTVLTPQMAAPGTRKVGVSGPAIRRRFAIRDGRMPMEKQSEGGTTMRFRSVLSTVVILGAGCKFVGTRASSPNSLRWQIRRYGKANDLIAEGRLLADNISGNDSYWPAGCHE